MLLIKAFLVAMSTYSAVPMPQFKWDERAMRYAICFLPVVGLLCGVLLFLWSALCKAIGVSAVLFAAVAVSIPVMVTGGIHLDGYMDTVDALASHQGRERRLEILKDSSCGAFAVIYCVAYFVICAALLHELYRLGCVAAVCPVFVFSRAMSAVCAVNMPSARKNGMLRAYTKEAARGKVNIAMAAVALLGAMCCVLAEPTVGAAAVLCGIATVPVYIRIAKGCFGGATGDTAGFFLQLCEFGCIVGAWIGAVAV